MKPRDRLERDLVKCEDMRLHAERAARFLAGALSISSSMMNWYRWR